MMSDEMQTNEIRSKELGFDRRDRTVRGHVAQPAPAGYAPWVAIGDGREVGIYMAGERVSTGDFVELENGLWWRVR